MAKHNIVGTEGETLAAHFLADNGFEILHRNYRLGRLEIDIIARKGCVVHFVEVKTRSLSAGGFADFNPEAAFTQSKKDKLMRAAAIFAENFQREDFREEDFEREAIEFSLDLVAIYIGVDGDCEIKYYGALHF